MKNEFAKLCQLLIKANEIGPIKPAGKNFREGFFQENGEWKLKVFSIKLNRETVIS